MVGGHKRIFLLDKSFYMLFLERTETLIGQTHLYGEGVFIDAESVYSVASAVGDGYTLDFVGHIGWTG